MEIRLKKIDILVLSTELIMLIGRLEEILELKSRAMTNLHYQLINSNCLVINPTDLTPPLLTKLIPFS